MVTDHIASGGRGHVAGIRQPKSMSDQFGVIDVARDGRRIRAFREKPTDVEACRRAGRDLRVDGQLRLHHPGALRGGHQGRQDPDSKHDMGGNIIPMLVERGEANVYDFRDNDGARQHRPRPRLLARRGTLDSFYEAHMDLIAIHPIFNLYNYDWPIYTENRPWPPAKFVHGWQERLGRAIGSMSLARCRSSPVRWWRTRSSRRTCGCTRGPTSRDRC
jgi:glucose-1-phosphate adenylyltransferase